ncbi:MAG: NRDE family protein [Sphingorhabdus sp.]
MRDRRGMCVVALALDCHPRWKLVLAGNRDEFHDRAALPLGRWSDQPDVIAGRDLQAGGGWLGVSDEGRLAVVTNIRNPDGPDPAKLSRGALVGDWLAKADMPDLSALPEYNPFNLLLHDGGQTILLSNLPEPQRQPLAAGVHGLSNGHPGEPWPRKSSMETALAEWIAADATPEKLFALLRDERILDDGGIPIFIRAPVYGTRCSTVVLVDREGRGSISERRFHPDGSEAGETRIDFRW